MENAGASVAIVEPTTLPNLWPIRDRLPQLRHVIGVGGAREAGVHDWDALLAKASRNFECLDTAADEPALIIYTSGTTGAPKGALQAQRAMLGNIPGFVHSHDFFPQGGRSVLVAGRLGLDRRAARRAAAELYFGIPILGYRGRFDAERAYDLLERYGVRNSFLFPTALKLMMKTVPEPRATYRLNLRSIMSAGESVGATVFEWAREQLGVTINEMFGQTEINYVVGNCQSAWPVKPGSIGRPYPGTSSCDHRRRRKRNVLPASSERSPFASSRRSGVLPRVLEEPAGDRGQVRRRLVPDRRPGARWMRTATSGTRAARTT